MAYLLHDLSRFPYVELRASACVPGFANTWCQEMDALLADHKLFVVAFKPSAIEETPEDFRTRALWFKTRRHLLAGRCAAMVAVVPSQEARTELTDDLAKRSRGFGVPYMAMESFEAVAAASAALVLAATAETELS